MRYDLHFVSDNQEALKTLSRRLHSKLKKIQGLFKDVQRNLRTFQGIPLKFKDFSNLCEPWIGIYLVDGVV